MVYTKLSTFTLQRKANGDGRGGEEVGTEPKKIAVARFSVPAGPGTSGGAFNFKINDMEQEVLWATRLFEYLRLWGDPWVVQLKAMLFELDVGFSERFFYFCHSDSGVKPISQITVLVRNGVGILGNVWTSPQHRRQGLVNRLMAAVKQDFKKKNWKALYLGTGYDNLAYNIYLKQGFNPVEPLSGYMEYYGEEGLHDRVWCERKRDAFESEWFPEDGVGDVTIEHLSWKHYPVLPPLFLSGNIPGIVRASPLNLIGRISSELPFINLIDQEMRRIRRQDLHQVQILSHTRTGAVVGIAMWAWEPNYKDTILLDVFCHKDFWMWGKALLAGLPLPRSKAQKFVVLGDMLCTEKIALFESQGFTTHIMSHELGVDKQKSKMTKMVYMEKVNPSFVPRKTTVEVPPAPSAKVGEASTELGEGDDIIELHVPPLPPYEKLTVNDMPAITHDGRLVEPVKIPEVEMPPEDTLPWREKGDNDELQSKVVKFGLLQNETARVSGDKVEEVPVEEKPGQTFAEAHVEDVNETIKKYMAYFIDDEESRKEMEQVEAIYMKELDSIEEVYRKEMKTAKAEFDKEVEKRWTECRDEFSAKQSQYESQVEEMMASFGMSVENLREHICEIVTKGTGIGKEEMYVSSSSSSDDDAEEEDVGIGGPEHGGDSKVYYDENGEKIDASELKRLEAAMGKLQKTLDGLESDSDSDSDIEMLMSRAGVDKEALEQTGVQIKDMITDYHAKVKGIDKKHNVRGDSIEDIEDERLRSAFKEAQKMYERGEEYHAEAERLRHRMAKTKKTPKRSVTPERIRKMSAGSAGSAGVSGQK
jgi:hypothetical protein